MILNKRFNDDGSANDPSTKDDNIDDALAANIQRLV
jgi:hypothetical protein